MGKHEWHTEHSTRAQEGYTAVADQRNYAMMIKTILKHKGYEFDHKMLKANCI